MKLSNALVSMALAMGAGSVSAQSIYPPTDAVIVTATRTAQTADESLATVTVITREEIQASQTKDVAELLRFQAGIDIGRNGGPGQVTSVFTRGTDSNHTLVLVDGVRINPGTIGGAPLQFLDPDIVERIEIVRGPRSTLYGSDAIGGIIQIFTRRGAKGTSVRVLGGGGEDKTREGAIGVHHGADGWRAGLDISGSATDGFPTRTESAIDSGYRNTSVNVYAGFKTGVTDFEVSRWQARGNVKYLDFFLDPLDQDFENSVTAVTLKAPLAASWATTLRLSRLNDELVQNQSDDFVRTQRDTLDWQNDIQLGREHLLTVGALLAREQAASLSFGTAFDVDTDTNALFVQDQWSRDDYRLLAALRYTDHETFGAHVTGELASGFDLNPATQAYASIGTGFRAPDSTDRFGFGGNPDLEPETSRNAELGVRFRLSSSQKATVAVFQNNIQDLIVFVDPDGLGSMSGVNQNVEEARIRGVETGYSFNARRWTVDVRGVIQDPENRETGGQLARRAKRSLTVNAWYEAGRYALGGNLLMTSERPDSDFSTTMNPGYGIVNLFGQYKPTKQLTVRARIENLFDKEYTLADGFNTRDRALFLNAEYNYVAR